jgi:HEAT repeat protein
VSEPGLSSPLAEERRRALDAMAGRGVEAHEVEAVAGLLLDPDRQIRVLACRALLPRAAEVAPEPVSRALSDPIDEVRASAVPLAAATGAHHRAELALLCGARRWPLAQRAALAALPQLVRATGILDADVSALLHAVAQMSPPPSVEERSGLGELARAVGPERLSTFLGFPDDRRLGAVRLLAEEGSEPARAALAGLLEDPAEEIRLAAHRAEMAAGMAPSPAARPEAASAEEPVVVPGEPVPAATHEPDPAEAGAPTETPALEPEVFAAMARGLEDPDEAVRERARRGVQAVPARVRLAWTRQALRSQELREAALGARVAEETALSRELARDLLERAAILGRDDRPPFVSALAAAGLPLDGLVELLQDVEPAVRHDAVGVLWEVGGSDAVPALQAALADPSAAVRMAVLDLIGTSGDPSAAEVAGRVLATDSSPAVRAAALQAAVGAPASDRRSLLERALDDPDPDVRATAIDVLAGGLSEDASGHLMEALDDPDERVRDAAARALAALPRWDLPTLWAALSRAEPEQVEQLLSMLDDERAEALGELALSRLGEPEPADRAFAVELVGRLGLPGAVEAAGVALRDPAVAVRRVAARSLAGVDRLESIPTLRAGLSDPDPSVRIEVARALALIDDDEVSRVLIEALGDPDVAVREVAGDALVQRSSPAVARELGRALAATETRTTAAQVLSRMGPMAVEPLIDALPTDDPDLRTAVGRVLEGLVGREPFLVQLGSLELEERLRAVEALGAMGGPHAVDGLARTLSDPDSSIRVRVLSLLGELDDPRAFEPVKRTFLHDPVNEVVAAAETALQLLSPGRPQTPESPPVD